MKKYCIQVSYSFTEKQFSIGSFNTPQETYKAMCQLAAKEAYDQNEDFASGKTCNLHFDAEKGAIDMHYEKPDSWSYFRVQKKEQEERVKEREKLWEPENEI